MKSGRFFAPFLFLVLIGVSESATGRADESIPEILKRHEQEIEALRSIVNELKTGRTRDTAGTNNNLSQESTCIIDIESIGRYYITATSLTDIWDHPKLSFSLRLIRTSNKFSQILVASTNPVMNRWLASGDKYPLKIGACWFVLEVEELLFNEARFGAMTIVLSPSEEGETIEVSVPSDCPVSDETRELDPSEPKQRLQIPGNRRFVRLVEEKPSEEAITIASNVDELDNEVWYENWRRTVSSDGCTYELFVVSISFTTTGQFAGVMIMVSPAK